MASGSVESQGPQLKGPTEVISNINRLLFDAVEKAEKVLEDLANVAQGRKEKGKNFHVGQASATEVNHRSTDAALSNNRSLNGFSLTVAPSMESRNTNTPLGNVVPSDSSVIKNRREGVTFMCRDRIFENGDKILLAREIWPSDGGTIELNRKKLDELITRNETCRRAKTEKEGGRSEAGRTPKYSPICNKTSLSTERKSFAQKDRCFSVRKTSSDYKKPDARHGSIDDSFETTLSSLTETLKTIKSDSTEHLQNKMTKQKHCEAGDSQDQRVYNSANTTNDIVVKRDLKKNENHPISPKTLVYVNDLAELCGLNLELNVLIGSEQEIAKEMTLQIECSDLKSHTSPMCNLRTSI